MSVTRLKQSGQAKRRPPPNRERDKGRMVEASTSRRHSGHRLIFEGSLVKWVMRITDYAFTHYSMGCRVTQGVTLMDRQDAHLCATARNSSDE
jgi:hypothetical protein